MPGTVTPPVTADEAIAMLDAALRYLDEVDFTQLSLEEQVQVLLTFEELRPLTAATRANIGEAAAARPAGGRHRVSAPPGPPQR
jgi:hypothetical protein